MKRILLSLLALAAVAPAAVWAAPKPAPAVTATAAPATVTYGSASTLSGTLTNGANAGGQTVTIQSTPFPYSAKFATIGTATTKADGTWSFAVKPDRVTRYRVRFKKATSLVTRVQVRARVTFAVSDRTPKKGQRVRFFGRVLPQHDGRKAYVQRRTASGAWKTVATTLLQDAPGQDWSTYSRRIRVRRSGTFRVRVPTGDFDHLKGTSRKLRLTAH